jgi:hypothetical protein
MTLDPGAEVAGLAAAIGQTLENLVGKYGWLARGEDCHQLSVKVRNWWLANDRHEGDAIQQNRYADKPHWLV